MSLKEAFKDKKIGNINTSIQDNSLIIENRETVNEILKDSNEVIPLVDFSDPANFAKYGSAELYYKDSIENIYQNFPYDGTKKEKQEFYNDLALYEKYIFDHEYPRYNGYVNLISSSYIKINFNSSNQIESRERELKYSTKLSSSVFSMNSEGNTFEFWFKEGTVDEKNYSLFQISGDTLESNGNFTISANIGGGGLEFFYYKNGAGGQDVILDHTEWQNLKNSWHHYSFSISKKDNKNILNFKVDANDSRSDISIKKIFDFGTAIDNDTVIVKSASIGLSDYPYIPKDIFFDEFKIWSSFKDDKWIAETWFSQVNGSGKNNIVNTDLSVYYKFNEGIISSSSIKSLDKVCLDYSGNFINGEIINYSLSNKVAGSAIEESGFFSFSEEKDLIIFSSNPEVQSFLEQKQILGREYDLNNTSQFFNLFPNWIRNEDELSNEELRKITQTICSYLDKLYLQIEFINKIKFSGYETNNQKSIPFGRSLLENKSIDIEDLFSFSSILEELYSRNEKIFFEEKFINIKNAIYKNIYNNLNYIYKSKGTEKSYRNLFRSFGIDDELLKFNLYINNAEIDISKSKKIESTIKKNLLDFSTIYNHTASVYQTSYNGFPSAIYNVGNKEKYLPQTIECQVFFPNIDRKRELFLWDMSSISSSIFGVHSTNTFSEDTTWTNDDLYNFNVYAVRDNLNSKGVNFVLKSNGFNDNFTLRSPYFPDIYDNTKWNFAVRIKPKIDDYVFFLEDRPIENYNLEFYGVQTDAGVVLNEFMLSKSLDSTSTAQAISNKKKLYVGSHRTNFTGSVLEKSDIKIINLKYWINYIDNDIIKTHNDNPNVYGGNNSTKKAFNGFVNSTKYDTNYINETETLILNWDFSSITSSNENGQFIVNDIKTSPKPLNILSDLHTYYYGKGIDFKSNSKIDIEYLNISKEQLPENINISDTVNIKNSNDYFSAKNGVNPELYISIEKSMYSIISEEMMNMFSSIEDFNNLLGNPLNLYKKDYKEMSFLKRAFFERVQNVPNFEKYLVLYKWIDETIGIIIKQLSPASAEIPDTIATIIESHILERNKYERKFSTFREIQKLTSYPIKGIRELMYNWKLGTAATTTDQEKPLWLKERAERTNPLVSSGNIYVDNIRQKILNSIINENNQQYYNLRDNQGNIYKQSNYILNRLSISYDFRKSKDEDEDGVFITGIHTDYRPHNKR